MLTLGYRDDQVFVEQTMRPPVVYLDHCALMDIADTQELADALVAAIAKREGTLALSWVNLAEFSKVSNAANAANVESLLERVRPHVFLIDTNMFAVIDRENTPRTPGDHRPPPQHDGVFLQALVHVERQSLDPLSFRGLFGRVASRQPQDYLASFRTSVVMKVMELRAGYATDANFARSVVASPSGPPRRDATLHLLVELLSLVLKDQMAPFGPNDAMDLAHAVVPSSYCEHVVLDSRWASLVGIAQGRLRRAGYEYRMAKVYSVRSNEVRRFLEELSG